MHRSTPLLPSRAPAAGWLTATTLTWLLATALPLSAAIITVNSTADVTANDAACTLREAITAANANAPSGGAANECAAGDPAPTVDTIAFAIPGAGPHTIAVATDLPLIVTPIAVDGYTQPGAGANTLPLQLSNNGIVNAVTPSGTNAAVRIRLIPSVPLTDGLELSGAGAAGSSVRGLQITGFIGAGVHAVDTSDVTIAGNFIGTDGSAPLGNGNQGVFLEGAADSTVGGTTPADVNLIAANTIDQVSVSQSTAVTVLNNLINTDTTANASLAGSVGVRVNSSTDVEIRGNVIGAASRGVDVVDGSTSGITVASNLIGVGVLEGDLAGTLDGIRVSNGLTGAPQNTTLGGAAPADANFIGHWANDGIRVEHFNAAQPSPTAISMRQNIVFDNLGLGINLVDTAGGSGAGVNPNDAGDADGGPNNGQNFPVINSASWNGSTLTMDVSFASIPNQGYVLEFFHTVSCDSSGNGEGGRFLGAISIADIGPTGTFSDPNAQLSGPFNISGGDVTATATNTTTGDTSEFSACRTVTLVGPPPPPAAIAIVGGNNQTTLINTAFPQPLQVLVTDAGGNPVPGVNVLFTPPGAGASAGLSPPNPVVTDAQGIATVTATANGTPGSYQVTANVQGGTFPGVAFDLTNVAGINGSDIPTLGGWGLLALALGLAGAGWLLARRR